MEKKSSLIVILAMVLALLLIGFASRACEATQSAREAQRLADIQLAADRAAAAEAAAEAAEQRADELRAELERRQATQAQTRRRIDEHRNAPINKNADPRDLVHSFVLLGYGLPR